MPSSSSPVSCEGGFTSPVLGRGTALGAGRDTTLGAGRGIVPSPAQPNTSKSPAAGITLQSAFRTAEA
jgi:hypothetical protein